MELTTKEWNSLIDNYGITGVIDSELYERCNEAQRWFINEDKKRMARIKDKNYEGE